MTPIECGRPMSQAGRDRTRRMHRATASSVTSRIRGDPSHTPRDRSSTRAGRQAAGRRRAPDRSPATRCGAERHAASPNARRAWQTHHRTRHHSNLRSSRDGTAPRPSHARSAHDRTPRRMLQRRDQRRHSTTPFIVRRRETIGDRRRWLARLGRVRRPRRRLGEIGSLDAAKRGFACLFAVRNAIEGRSLLDRGDRFDERVEHASTIGGMGSVTGLGVRASGRCSRSDRPPSSWLRDWLPVRWHRRRGRDASPRRPRSPPRGERDLRHPQRFRRLRRLAVSRDVRDGQVRKRFGTHDAPAADAGLA